jgi:hypothetical protein
MRSMPATTLIKCSTKCQRGECAGKSTKCACESNRVFFGHKSNIQLNRTLCLAMAWPTGLPPFP